MKYEVHEVFVVWTPDSLNFKLFETRGDALRHAQGNRNRVTVKRVIASSGRGPYRKPYVPAKKRAKK